MRLHKIFLNPIRAACMRLAVRREPDVIIGGKDNPYLLRWHILPRNAFVNLYLHMFLRSDDDRALHDHPWLNASLLLSGSYVEHRIRAGGVHTVETLHAGAVKLRLSGSIAHRIELLPSTSAQRYLGMLRISGRTDSAWPRGGEQSFWTLFATALRYREWGFHCKHGWVHWKDFTSASDPGSIGKGCDQ
ncbi:MAG: hypothetical protein ACRCV9_14455 [Burkholderiaceae bacterium]